MTDVKRKAGLEDLHDEKEKQDWRICMMKKED